MNVRWQRTAESVAMLRLLVVTDVGHLVLVVIDDAAALGHLFYNLQGKVWMVKETRG